MFIPICEKVYKTSINDYLIVQGSWSTIVIDVHWSA